MNQLLAKPAATSMPTDRPSPFVPNQRDFTNPVEMLFDRSSLTLVGFGYAVALFDGARTIAAVLLLAALEILRWRVSSVYTVSLDTSGQLTKAGFGGLITLLLAFAFFAMAALYSFAGALFADDPARIQNLAELAQPVLAFLNGEAIRDKLESLGDYDALHREVALAANALWGAAAFGAAILIIFRGGLFVFDLRRRITRAAATSPRQLPGRNIKLRARIFLYSFLVLVSWMLSYALVSGLPRDIPLYDFSAYVISTVALFAGALAGPTLLINELFFYRLRARLLDGSRPERR